MTRCRRWIASAMSTRRRFLRDATRVLCAWPARAFGGVLAIETARKLEALGAVPEHVFLFDTRLHPSLHRIVHDIRHNGWLTRKLGEFMAGNRREMLRRARFLASDAWHRLMRRAPAPAVPALAANTALADSELQMIFRDLAEAGSEAYRGPAAGTRLCRHAVSGHLHRGRAHDAHRSRPRLGGIAQEQSEHHSDGGRRCQSADWRAGRLSGA